MSLCDPEPTLGELHMYIHTYLQGSYNWSSKKLSPKITTHYHDNISSEGIHEHPKEACNRSSCFVGRRTFRWLPLNDGFWSGVSRPIGVHWFVDAGWLFA